MTGAVSDDARHALLRKARGLGQPMLEAFGAGPEGGGPLVARGDFGRYQVKEVDAKTALTKCQMPGEPYSLNPYVGCTHDCLYCYVPDVAKVDRTQWGSYAIVKRNLPTVLAREIQTKPPRVVFMSSATDPYQPAEGTHLVTRRCLEVLAHHDWPVHVLTRNPLVTRDIDLFRRFSRFEIGMSVPTFDDAMRRHLEPGAPTIEARLRTLRTLTDEGFEPFVNIAPCYPFSGGVTARDVAESLVAAGVARAYAWPWRYRGGVMPALTARLPATVARPLLDAIRDDAHFERQLTQLHRAFDEVGLPLNPHGHASRTGL